MPAGNIHEQYRKQGRIIAFPVAVLIPILLSPLPLKTGGELLVGIGIFVGYEIGKYVENDWDLMVASTSEGRMVNDIPVLGHILFGVSSAYGSVFRKHHRSFWTHFPFVATAIRYLYIFWWIWLEIYRSELDWAWLIFIFVGMYLGTSMSDLVHFLLDTYYNPTGE